MKRLAFNGGEVSPELALRSELDVYHRACRCVENFDISVMGGVKRRRGMRFFADGQRSAKLFAYEYNENERYLVELGQEFIRVYNMDGEKEFEAESGYAWPLSVCGEVVNAVMLFASVDHPIMELRHEGNKQWSWKEFLFKHEPWRYNEYRDYPLTVNVSEAGVWTVKWDVAEDAVEKEPVAGGMLRLSYWTEPKEAVCRTAEILQAVTKVGALSKQSSFSRGQKLAVRGESKVRYYTCVEDWQGTKVDDDHPAIFVEGLSSPANYTQNFVVSEAGGKGDELNPITALTAEMKFTKGQMLAFETGYWEYFTVIRNFEGGNFKEGLTSPADYPGFFVRGLPIGEALPCKGTWKFVCSGAWIGEYEVRRNADSAELSEGEWESRGTSFSPLSATLNVAVTGDESEEECWVRLFVTKSYYMGDDLRDGFPNDTCGNKLVVSSYKHDMELVYSETEDAESGEVTETRWDRVERVPVELETGVVQSRDWSWSAFNEKYGYPCVVELHEMRLCFAGTKAQPLTIWMSKNDDLDNFELGEKDDSALAVTMAGKTQDPICWLMSRSNKLQLGTTNAEYIVCSPNGAALTYANVRCENYGYRGSARIQAIQASDKVLYCQRGGGRLFEYGYNYESDGFISKDLTVFAAHVLSEHGGVVDGCYSRVPDPRVVFALGDGQVALMTYNSMHDVNAWQRYVTEGKVTSCAAVRNPSEADSLFFLVERTDEEYDDNDEPTEVTRVCIEVIDGSSGYTDNGGRDYVSTVLTNAITVQQADVRKGMSPAVYFYLGEETEVEGLEVTIDGESWRPMDRNESMLGAGWQQMVTDGGIKWEKALGLRAKGERGLSVLAMQS